MTAKRAGFVLIILTCVFVWPLYPRTLPLRKDKARWKIYTIKNNDTGETFKVQLDHRPTEVEMMSLESTEMARRAEESYRRAKALVEGVEKIAQIEAEYRPPGFKERTFNFAEGELESIPEAIGGLASAVGHPVVFTTRTASDPLSTIPFVSGFGALRRLCLTGTISPAWFEEAGKDVGLGSLLVLLMIAYGVGTLVLRLVPDLRSAHEIRWFFGTPVILTRARWGAARKWARWITSAHGVAGEVLAGKISALICIVLLAISAATTWPHDFITIVRFVVCAASIYLAYTAVAARERLWGWLTGGAAVLFNPLLPIRLQRTTWRALDLLMGLVFMAWLVRHRHNS
ncbi:MAG TPA: DUF6804 family protein [Terriglobia bacterium]|nr:DUF6804 family protein [Terriglobia bacterium]